jgi:hypothetical protein
MTRFAYLRRTPAFRAGLGRLGIAGSAFLAFAQMACTAGIKATPTGSSGSTGSGSAGTTGAAGVTGSAGTGLSGTTGTAATGGTTPPDGGCQQYDVKFVPKTPTVFVLVDRSGSEFDSPTTGTFFNLRGAVLQVLQQLKDANANIRLGFGAFVGDHASGACKPVLDTVPIDLIANSYDAISAKYTALGPLQPYGSKSDTPASAVIPMVQAALQSDTGNGQKYMLFVTDSESDFCDDGSAVCPADAVTYELQGMFTAGIGTLVVGLPSPISGISTTVLQNFANAGAGQPVVLPSGVPTPTDVYYQCTGAGNGQWMSLYTAAGRTMAPLAMYSTTAGTASVYSPGSTSQSALATQIAAALADVKSCTFDLGGHIKVSLDKLNKASVMVNGSTVPLDAANKNGWDMTSDTVLELFGPACDMWRDPSVNEIKFNFPCDIIIT